jgi:steroid 5-alpha reductase family enzyme
VVVVYLLAAMAAVVVGLVVRDRHPLTVALIADGAATLAIFAASMTIRNSSMYDTYWSVAPPAIAAWFVVVAEPGTSGTRQLVVMTGVIVWSVRLTTNWIRDWPGLAHEDWRYVDLRAKVGLPWPVTSLFGVHLFPTVQVALGCLALWPALGSASTAVGAFDVVALALMVGGAAIEYVADEQMRRFRRTKQPGEIMRRGLWSRCRHPNYLGEILFWVGVFVAGVSADVTWWWTVVGPVAMIAMFLGASIPMLDQRSVATRPGYDAVMAELPALLPFRLRRS